MIIILPFQFAFACRSQSMPSLWDCSLFQCSELLAFLLAVSQTSRQPMTVTHQLRLILTLMLMANQWSIRMWTLYGKNLHASWIVKFEQIMNWLTPWPRAVNFVLKHVQNISNFVIYKEIFKKLTCILQNYYFFSIGLNDAKLWLFYF